VVAHRLTQAASADQIIVLDAGRVVEQGTHAELVGAGQRYAELWRAWAR
jgi:ATP-binding cassette, subfamily C, bacterial